MTLTYVIPDIHGCSDLLDKALSAIMARDVAGVVVTIGDYVDKGPQSKEVIERMLLGVPAGWTLVALKGNHDALMVEALRNPAGMAEWIEKGGDAALASYGGDAAGVPGEHLAWLDQLALMHVDCHRVYVHAGVDPHIPLEAQSETTLLCHRYLASDAGGHGERHVVHGHDKHPDGPLLRAGRTNLDTAAWQTGRLVVGVFDDDRAGGPVDLIEIRGTPADR